ncbi:MAG: hypothetical protein HRF50_15195 [Phycisphaerae bacterium]|jgi:hypothetical protein
MSAAGLSPDWSLDCPPGIEWTAAAPNDCGGVLIVCTRGSRLQLYELASGVPILRTPLDVQPGARFGGAHDSLAYVYSRSQVFALPCSPGAGMPPGRASLRWCTAVTNSTPGAGDGDPEFLVRVVGGAATPHGFFFVRSDDRVGLLRVGDGTPAWSSAAPVTDATRLHIDGDALAIVSPGGERLSVSWVRVSADGGDVTTVWLDRRAPLWSGVCGNEVVLVWPREIGLVRDDGQVRWTAPSPSTGEFSGPHFLTNCRRRASTALQPAGAEPARLLIWPTGRGGLLAYELDFGASAPYSELPEGWEFPIGTPTLQFSRAGDTVVWVGPSIVRFFGADDGVPHAQLARAGQVISAACVDGHYVALFATPPDDGGSARRRDLRLARSTRRDTPRLGQSPSAIPDREDCILGEIDSDATAQLVGGRLLVVEADRIRAYTLP